MIRRSGSWDTYQELLSQDGMRSGEQTWRQKESVQATECFADAMQLEICLPQEIGSTPGGHWSLVCACCPITRLPFDSDSRPSLLDWVLAPPSRHLAPVVEWTWAPADHAILVLELPLQQP